MILINIIFIILILIILFLINLLLNNKREETFINNFNIPIAIGLEESKCGNKSFIKDYDEIDLNLIKTNSLDMQIELETKQKPIIPKEKIFNLPKITTYMDLPGYKASNIEILNNYELKENNHGLINYTELRENERFKPKNSLISFFSKNI
jgi:hypothetical protein